MCIFQKANAPKHLFSDIVKWTEKHHQVISKKKVATQDKTFDLLKKQCSLKKLDPKQKKCMLPASETSAALTCHDFDLSVVSLLTDPQLMCSENLLFRDANNSHHLPMDGTDILLGVNPGETFFFTKICCSFV